LLHCTQVLPSLRVLISTFHGVPGMIGMHGGLPPASAFPITNLAFTLQNGHRVEIDCRDKVTLATSATIWWSSNL
jgi:hypothetical protein